jgi:MFS family permease
MNDPNAKKVTAAIMFLSFILMLICAFGLALIVTRLFLTGWEVGLKLGLLTGVCFAATAVSISYLYEKRPLGLHLINIGYNILGNIIAAVIIASWR